MKFNIFNDKYWCLCNIVINILLGTHAQPSRVDGSMERGLYYRVQRFQVVNIISLLTFFFLS